MTQIHLIDLITEFSFLFVPRQGHGMLMMQMNTDRH
jgi:hypothetical protein